MGSTIRSTNTFEGHHVPGTADPKNLSSLVISHHSHVKTQLFKRAAAPALRLACSAVAAAPALRLACSAVSALGSCHVHHGPCRLGPVHALLWLSQPFLPSLLGSLLTAFQVPSHICWVLVCLSWRSRRHRVCFGQHDDLIEVFVSNPTARAGSSYRPSSGPTVSESPVKNEETAASQVDSGQPCAGHI